MDFKELILENLNRLSIADLIEIHNAIKSRTGMGNIEIGAAAIKGELGMLESVKYVKGLTGWSLKECKAFCDLL